MYQQYTSWNAIMEANSTTKIRVLSSSLFRTSKYRICIIKEAYRTEGQQAEPFVYCVADSSGYLQGTARDVRSHNGLIKCYHLSCQELLDYIKLHENNNNNNEPLRGFKTVFHKEYQPGNMSIQSLAPLMTEKHWIDRHNTDILHLKVALLQHLLCRSNNLLSTVSNNNSTNTIMNLQRQQQQNYEHLMEKFAKNGFFNKLNNRQRKKIHGKSRKGEYCISLAPEQFKKHLKRKMLSLGGRQTNYNAGKEIWRIDKLNNEKASGLILKNFRDGARLRVVDKNGQTFKAENVSLIYSMRTVKLSTMYTIEKIKNGRRHARN